MKVPYSWLNELVCIHETVYEIEESLSMAGFEVESIEDLSKRVEGVVVGYIEEIEKHPNADKLRVCTVNTGDEVKSQIVCGASNVRKNIHVLVAVPGAYLSAKDIEIKSSKLRGVKSDGMICSLSEIGLTDKSNGIAILEELDINIPNIGENVLSLFNLNDYIIDIAITANRPDGMSIVGIARELSALTENELSIPTINFRNKTSLFKPMYKDNDSFDKNSLYSLTILTKIESVTKSPYYIKDRLNKSGLNSVNTIVDLTNYIMLEQGQPLHAFDLDSLEKITNRHVSQESFGIRKALNSEKINALDGKTYNLSNDITIITCHDIPIAVAGVIGSIESSVHDATKSVVLEGALFSSKSVRLSARKLGLRTESSSRYEKGISEQNTIYSINRFLELLQRSFTSDISETYMSNDIEIIPHIILLRKDRIDKVLGPLQNNLVETDNITPMHSLSHKNSSKKYLSDSDVEKKLILLGCKCIRKEKSWQVTVPSYRSIDLRREIDLIEEIARLIGYDRFEAKLPYPIKPGGLTPSQSIQRKIRSYLCSSGLQEITTSSLVSESKFKEKRIAIANPLLAETSHLRTNLWEEHLNICNRNMSAGQKGCWIFEIGSLYNYNNNKMTEEIIIGGAITGKRTLEQWTNYGRKSSLDYNEARGLIESIFRILKLNIIDKTLSDDKLLHPGRASEIYLESKCIGKFGQVHPYKLTEYDLDNASYLFELELNPIIEAASRKNKLCPKFAPYPIVPTMERDLALIVDKKCTSQEITAIIQKTGKPLLEKVELIDRYEGENLPKGKISKAFRITYRDSKTTLQEADINPIHDKIRQMLVDKLKAEPRS
ncbi:phenylalanine--tRNA ligase subunit beta [Prochlorococcus sp. MIT 1223]|uniref:phenylalanine--tRNA ligase subunit beta n=1 Tax=Prochlorococcus sp. MIT 1223 TaxID=3096217 RepID=UPI002A75B4FB|nr:phenylalanine--tRNA ligase subunit beta [Prochlorococcus sp. MIT 1223]